MNEVSIVGLGIKHATELTLAGVAELKTCDIVLVYAPFSCEIQTTLDSNSLLKTQFIDHLYQDGKVDQSNYDSVYSYILSMTKHYKKIGVLITGHPWIGVSVVQKLARTENIRLTTMEGISSFDTMINDLNLDPLERGTSIVDVNRMLLFKLKMNPFLNLFLYHVASIGVAKVDIQGHTFSNNGHLLQKKLMESLPSDKKVALITSSVEKTQAQIDWFQLSELSTKLKTAKFWSSLFVPAEIPVEVDTEFLTTLGFEESTRKLEN